MNEQQAWKETDQDGEANNASPLPCPKKVWRHLASGVIGSARVMHGECRKTMNALDPESIDAIVTDPPYELRFMGKAWDASGVSYDRATWEACYRTLKPGGYLLAFGGSRTFHRIAVAIEDAGFEIRDTLSWLYGSGFPKSHNLQGEWSGFGTALKPAWEPIIMARKPFKGTVADNVLTYGTGAINVDACRIDGVPPSKPQPSFNSPTGNVYGFKAGEGRNGEMSKASGRWPANVVLDEDAAELLDQMSGYQKDGFHVGRNRKSDESTNKIFGARLNDMQDGGYGSGGGASRFFYTSKASRSERGKGNTHPTVKPISLMRWLCRMVTPPGGTVLDPFAGSGTTLLAARQEGFAAIGIELETGFIDIINDRCFDQTIRQEVI